MSPALIDLTSSPEPDDSPETAARSALQTFRPRKRKERDSTSGRIERERENGISPSQAAQAALEDFKPRKEKKRMSGLSDDSAQTPLGAPLPDDARIELAKVREEKRRVKANNVQEGSLASLLQHEAQKSSRPSTSKDSTFRNKGWNPATLHQRSRDSPNRDTETERIQVLSTFQRRQPNGINLQPQSKIVLPVKEASEQTPPKSFVPTAMRSPAKVMDLVRDENQEGSPNVIHSKQREVLSGGSNESPRPFKRRRVGESDNRLPHIGDCLAYGRRKSQDSAQASPAPPLRSARVEIPIRSASPASPVTTSTSQAPSKQHHPPRVSNGHNLSNGSPNVSQNRPLTGNSPSMSNVSEQDASSRSAPLNGKQAFAHEFIDLTREQWKTSQDRSDLSKNDTSPSLARPLPKKREAIVSLQHGTRLSNISSQKDKLSSEKLKPVEVDTVVSVAVKATQNKKASGELYPADEVVLQSNDTKTSSGEPYTADEDALLIKLKEVDKLSWEEIPPHFNGRRSRGSLQVRYSSKLKGRWREPEAAKSKPPFTKLDPPPAEENVGRSGSPESDAPTRRPRKRRNNEASVAAGFISWADVKKKRLAEDPEQSMEDEDLQSKQGEDTHQFNGERAHPKSLLRILRQREFGSNVGRSWVPTTRSVSDELKERVFDDMGPRKYYKGTSGDVTCLAWAPNGKTFAAGSIAITDERSMQYNRPCNLLLGYHNRSVLQELPEHHISRPSVEANSGNVNGLHSMRKTQDPRLFMTVASVQFSPDSETLYSAGCDRKVRAYEVDNDRASCLYAIEHAAPLDLLSVSNSGILATACHQSANKSIGIYRGQDRLVSLSPRRADEQTKRAIYPSALRWGAAHHHSNLLLAGFSIDSIDEERNIAGETCLWDVRSEARLEISGVTRNVFDVAWNPSPTSTSSIFAVASSRGTGKPSKGTRSVVQCFAPGQNRASRVVEWECPAFDINDVVYCQHDDNLIAAGATDGRIYLWDQRFADRSHGSLHVLQHGDTLNVLDHDREREIADTGVRFVAWGATSSRLYTGSSDGVVKVWNPYRSTEDAHLKDVATFNSAVMSGAFSPDNRDLLIGEDQGRINSLSVGYEHKAVRSMQQFELRSAPAPVVQHDRFAALRELRKSGQICLKPMGDLPRRQAVQGPYYRGPYLKPSTDELITTKDKYRLALDEQNEAESREARSGSPSSFDDFELREANKRVQDAQSELMRLQSRLDDSDALEPCAQANQRAFLRRAEARLELEVSNPAEHCKLDCNYLPSSVDDDGEVPDSGRSELRIPGALRPSRPANTSDLIREEILEAGMTYKCISCLGATQKPRPGKQALCEQCHQTRMGLTASCELCSSPIRASTGISGSNLCERCNFACFRCGKASIIARDLSLVTCDRCGLTWKAGVLGYELVKRAATSQKSSSKQFGNKTFDDGEGLGHSEIQHYALRWRTKI